MARASRITWRTGCVLAGDEMFQALDEEPDVGEDQRAIEAIHDQAGNRLGRLVVADVVQRRRARHAPEQGILRAGDLAQDHEQRQHDPHQNAGQDAEGDHARTT